MTDDAVTPAAGTPPIDGDVVDGDLVDGDLVGVDAADGVGLDEPTPAGGVVVVATRPRRKTWRIVWVSALALFGLALGYYLVNLWQVHSVGRSDQARPVDAIVVMGAAQYDGRPSPQLAARLDHVVELWNAGYAPLVVTTGGNQPGDRFTEAEASANYLADRGVPAEAIVQVTGSDSFESLQLAQRELVERGLSRVLLVSDPYHSLRIRMIAAELGLEAYVSPTRTSPVTGREAMWREAREAGGVAVGRLIGFDRLRDLTG